MEAKRSALSYSFTRCSSSLFSYSVPKIRTLIERVNIYGTFLALSHSSKGDLHGWRLCCCPTLRESHFPNRTLLLCSERLFRICVLEKNTSTLLGVFRRSTRLNWDPGPISKWAQHVMSPLLCSLNKSHLKSASLTSTISTHSFLMRWDIETTMAWNWTEMKSAMAVDNSVKTRSSWVLSPLIYYLNSPKLTPITSSILVVNSSSYIKVLERQHLAQQDRVSPRSTVSSIHLELLAAGRYSIPLRLCRSFKSRRLLLYGGCNATSVHDQRMPS